MKFSFTRLSLAIASAGLLILYGCGGGGSSSTSTSSSTLSGTAATGAPIAGQVVAIDSTGAKFYATTSAEGAYTLNVAGGVAPFILTVTGTSGGQSVTLNSIATAVGQTVNITPLTDLILSTAAGQTGGATFAELCASTVSADQTACRAAATTATTGGRLTQAVADVKAMITSIGGAGVDPLNGAFAANGTSTMDAILDKILVKPAASFGSMATVTLIAVPGQQLGTMTLGASAGAATTPATIAISGAIATAATDAATVLSEVRTCVASLAALYPANLTVAPSSAAVSLFIDSTFSFAGATNSAKGHAYIETAMSTLAPSGMAKASLTVKVRGLSNYSFDSVLNPTAVPSSTTSALSSGAIAIGSTVWGQFEVAGDDMHNWKMVKRAAYAGCPGGWKIAGPQHIDLHNNARVTKTIASGGAITYGRRLAFHILKTDAVAEGVVSIDVYHDSLRAYTSSGTGAGALKTLQMNIYAATNYTMQVIDQQLDQDAIRSCQDIRAAVTADASLVAATGFAPGTICYDDTRLKPGDSFVYTLYNAANSTTYTGSNGGNVRSTGFPFVGFYSQVSNVPLSKTFVSANDADLFAQSVTVAPATVSALNAALAGTSISAAVPNNLITFNYTQSAVYGIKTDHCSIKLFDALNVNTIALQVEMNAAGQQTSCSFASGGLDPTHFTKTVANFDTNSNSNNVVWIGSRVLGNQSVTTQPYR